MKERLVKWIQSFWFCFQWLSGQKPVAQCCGFFFRSYFLVAVFLFVFFSFTSNLKLNIIHVYSHSKHFSYWKLRCSLTFANNNIMEKNETFAQKKQTKDTQRAGSILIVCGACVSVSEFLRNISIANPFHRTTGIIMLGEMLLVSLLFATYHFFFVLFLSLFPLIQSIFTSFGVFTHLFFLFFHCHRMSRLRSFFTWSFFFLSVVILNQY